MKSLRIVVFPVLLAFLAGACSAPAQPAPLSIQIDANAQSHPFPHFWEQMFGSGRAVLALRDNYRKDLKEVHDQVGARYVRFHAIFHDEVGVYDEDDKGNPVFNFSYVDQIYDGLLAEGRTAVCGDQFHAPQTGGKRGDPSILVQAECCSAQELCQVGSADRRLRTASGRTLWHRRSRKLVLRSVERTQHRFLGGEPKQETYFELYDHTARALKTVSPRLRVGGPATAAAHWIPEFLRHIEQEHVPADFISSHGYADDRVEDMFGTRENIPMQDRVCRAIQMVQGQIRASSLSTLPLMWTEWNVPSFGPLHARDNWYVGPALARDISQCDGSVQMMSYWTFDDVFEEGGVAREALRWRLWAHRGGPDQEA